jgi:hypothetical protein
MMLTRLIFSGKPRTNGLVVPPQDFNDGHVLIDGSVQQDHKYALPRYSSPDVRLLTW